MQPREWCYTSLDSPADALKLCHQRWLAPYKHAEPWPVNTTIAFNGLAARIKKLGVSLPRDKILFGLQLAIDEPAAMKQYLGMLVKSSGSDLHLTNDTSIETITYLSQKMHKSSQLISSAMVKRKYAQLFEVVTGWRNPRAQQLGKERQPSLYHLMLACGNHENRTVVGATPWASYIQLVSMLGVENAVYTEWLNFKAQTSEHGISESLIMSRNAVIRALVRQGDPVRAWQLTYESSNPAKDVEDETWQELLQYPEGVKKWIPEMNRPAIVMLSKDLARLEHRLGIEWKGAEDGYHVTSHKPFWVREDESNQEEADYQYP
ncbi:MAG: hypothetical protein Q9163_004305 [Psora crenata]